MAAVGEGRTMTLGALSGFRRDARIIGLVGSAHFTSHFFQLALPPLFPLLRAEFRTSYVALGLLMTVFFGASGIMQTVSRDMLVRAATPPGASGKVYGFVYSGLDLGSSITPLVFGWLLDRGEPRLVFVMTAGFMLLTIVTVVQVRRHGRSAALAR